MKNNQLSFEGVSVWMVCVSFYLYELLLRTILGTFQEPLMRDLNLNSFDFALLSSTAYLLIYAVMQMPVSSIIKRFGIKYSMLFATLICVFATVGFSWCHSLATALLFRGLMGFGSAFGFIGMLVAVYDWLPYKNIALFIGISQFLGTLGPMTAAGPLNTLIHSTDVSWRSCFYILSMVGLLIAILIALLVKQNKQSEQTFILLKNPLKLDNQLLTLLKQSEVWFIAFSYAMIYFSIEYFSENEGKHLLMSKGFSSTFASYMITLAWLGFAIGSPLFGYLSDRISRRKPLLIFSAAITFLSLIGIIYWPLTKLGALITFFIYGLSIGSSSIGIAIMSEQFKFDNISMGMGIKNTVTIMFISIMAPVVSYLLTLTSNNTHYTLINFQQVFILIILFPLIALLFYTFKVRETYCRSTKETIILNYKNEA